MVNPWPTSKHLLVVLAAIWLVGCGGATQRRTSTVEAVTMEPVRVTARRTDGGDLELDAYDARDLLRLGNEALTAGRCDEAIERYDRLIREFSGSTYVSAAHYNAALCLEREGDQDAAAERYLALVRDVPNSDDVRDALFQAIRCYERLRRWDRAVDVADRLLERTDLSPDERLEAMTRRGTALVEAGRSEEGEVQLRRAVALYREAGPDAIRTDYYLAQAQYYLGESPRRQMADVQMTSDESQFRQALEQRCELLLRAQTQYVQAIRAGNAHWGAASAYRIGEMYSTLFDDVMEIPLGEIEVPADLTSPEERQAFLDEYPRHYRRLLRQRLEPLLHNAIRWWESNLMMIERTGIGGEWVDRTRADLERVQRLLEELDDSDGSDDGESGGSDPSSNPESGQTSEVTVD